MNCLEVDSEVTEEQVGAAEAKILRACEWILAMPSCETWMSAFWKRFNIYTDGKFDPQLQSLYVQGGLTLPFALRWYTLGQATVATLTPRRAACGPFCQGLVRVGLLPAERLAI